MTRAHRLPLVARLPTASMKAPKTAHPKVRSTEYLKASMTASGWVHSTDCSKALKTAQRTASTTVPKMGHPKVHSTDCWKASTKAAKNARKNRSVRSWNREAQTTINNSTYYLPCVVGKSANTCVINTVVKEQQEVRDDLKAMRRNKTR